jgi:hypothetical protein
MLPEDVLSLQLKILLNPDLQLYNIYHLLDVSIYFFLDYNLLSFQYFLFLVLIIFLFCVSLFNVLAHVCVAAGSVPGHSVSSSAVARTTAPVLEMVSVLQVTVRMLSARVTVRMLSARVAVRMLSARVTERQCLRRRGRPFAPAARTAPPSSGHRTRLPPSPPAAGQRPRAQPRHQVHLLRGASDEHAMAPRRSSEQERCREENAR